jgi:hypothetical protein
MLSMHPAEMIDDGRWHARHFKFLREEDHILSATAWALPFADLLFDKYVYL